MRTEHEKFFAKAIGIFTLVYFGVGSAVLAGDDLGFVWISSAFGISIIAMAYSIGHISRAHLSTGVSLGVLVLAKRPQQISSDMLSAKPWCDCCRARHLSDRNGQGPLGWGG
ncbi:MAG: aquaporin [Pseudomonadota bacterium]